MLGRTLVAAAQKPSSGGVCGQGRGRTADLTIFSRALYQLSYLTGVFVHLERQRPGSPAVVAELTGFEPATFTLTG